MRSPTDVLTHGSNYGRGVAAKDDGDEVGSGAGRIIWLEDDPAGFTYCGELSSYCEGRGIELEIASTWSQVGTVDATDEVIGLIVDLRIEETGVDKIVREAKRIAHGRMFPVIFLTSHPTDYEWPELQFAPTRRVVRFEKRKVDLDALLKEIDMMTVRSGVSQKLAPDFFLASPEYLRDLSDEAYDELRDDAEDEIEDWVLDQFARSPARWIAVGGNPVDVWAWGRSAATPDLAERRKMERGLAGPVLVFLRPEAVRSIDVVGEEDVPIAVVPWIDGCAPVPVDDLPPIYLTHKGRELTFAFDTGASASFLGYEAAFNGGWIEPTNFREEAKSMHIFGFGGRRRVRTIRRDIVATAPGANGNTLLTVAFYVVNRWNESAFAAQVSSQCECAVRICPRRIGFIGRDVLAGGKFVASVSRGPSGVILSATR